MFNEETFTGLLKKITHADDFVTLIFKLPTGEYAHTFTGPKYRNYRFWKDYRIGDEITGLKWHDRNKKRIDADCPPAPKDE